MEDVARLAGVSVTTVSHVVNRTRSVSDETRQRVDQAIQSTGYIHYAAARSLVASRTRSIGIAVSSISDDFCARLVGAIEGRLQSRDFMILLAETHDNSDQELRAVKALEQRRVEGLLLAPVNGNDSATLAYLRDRKVPTVLVDRCCSVDFDQVGTENVEATAQLVDHLAALGHTRIGLVHSLPHIATTRERIQGYQVGLERNNLRFDRNLMVSGGAAAEPAERSVANLLLARRTSPTGLVVGNNLMALGALRALHAQHLQVPRDVAVASFDDFVWADHLRPRLTTVRQLIPKIGATAVQMLFNRIDNPQDPPQTIRIDTIFIDRESCGCSTS
jgi:LacI family transcriptional regulator